MNANSIWTAEENADIERKLLALERLNEYEAALAASKDSFEAYWAGSASASVMRDYKAGRVKTVRR